MQLRTLLLIFSLTIVFQSCVKDDDFVKGIETDNNLTEKTPFSGKLLQNPYEISNIKKAYQKVIKQMADGNMTSGKGFSLSAKGDSSDIAPNYIYVRFDPKNAKQEQRLKEKKRFTVIDYPLEYENPEDYRRNSNRKENEIPSYWTSVPIDKKMPKNIPYVILQEMYIPEKDPKYNNTKGQGKTNRGKVNDEIDFMNHLLEEAYVSTDNADLLPEAVNEPKTESCETCFLGINLRAKWNPSGRIQIWDDEVGSSTSTIRTNCRTVRVPDYSTCGTGGACPTYRNETRCDTETRTTNGSYVPLVGAQVLVRDTWTLGNAITDNNGNYRFSSVRAKVRYLIQWERYQYSVRDDGGIFQAEDKGPKYYKKAWNHQISGGREKYRGEIHKAAHNYYYGGLSGLQRPPNNFTNRQTKIRARERCCDGVNEFYLPYLTGGIWPTITIKEYGATSKEVFGTTTHEIAHSTHAARSPINFPIANKRHRESYAQFIELILTNQYYRNLVGDSSWEYQSNYQTRTIAGNRVYTTFFVDLWDDYNQRVEEGSSSLPNDKVKNYTFRQIEEAIFKRTDFSGVVRELQKLNNPTENELWNLRNQWGD